VAQLIAHDLRWKLLERLGDGDFRVSELVEWVGERQNLVSYHLGLLRSGGLVTERRSSADGRDVYYALDLTRLEASISGMASSLHPALRVAAGAKEDEELSPKSAPLARILFLCTANSARSQMAEALLRNLSRGSIAVQSAGSRPESVHPRALAALNELGVPADGLRSKNLSEFAGERFDYIISLCDKVREECPVFPGDPERIHWSFADPAAVEGSQEDVHAAFMTTASELTTRLRYLLLTLDRNRRG
jgi:ArsR family transcriptional regulator, arsenate/arsenite/antimonite-responsive transcriptional repressor / arsenate reductase (thioredoxin)